MALRPVSGDEGKDGFVEAVLEPICGLMQSCSDVLFIVLSAILSSKPNIKLIRRIRTEDGLVSKTDGGSSSACAGLGLFCAYCTRDA